MDGKEIKEYRKARQDTANTIKKSFITVVFCLPELNPVDSQTLNYTPVAIGIVGAFTLGSWVFARKWFVGPVRGSRMVDGRREVELTTGQDVVEGVGQLDVSLEKRG